MSADAQRLVAMSMGKIAASRGQRGGINLHKNLLVATVLTKARTIMLLENYHHMMENRRMQLESQDNRMQYRESSEHSSKTSDHAPFNEPRIVEAQNGGNGIQQDSCRYSDNNGASQENKENASPNVQNRGISNENVELDCGRCTKRRLSQEDCYDMDKGEEYIPLKKCKTDTEFEQNNQQFERTEHTPMETSQMTNLVNSFNSGFTGLLSSESHIPHSDLGYSSAEDEDDDDVFTTNSTTKPENSLISCSTQIKEAFETLSRPCITLSV